MGIVRDLYYAQKMGAGLKLPAPSVALLIKRLALAKILTPAVLKTVTGALLHITDALEKPAEELLVDLAPIQSLNGYSSPWPAGGGKNLIPTTLEQLKAANTSGTWADNVYSISDLTFTVNADGTITVNGTSSAAVYFNFRRYQEGLTIPAGDYVLHKTGNADINVSAGKNNAYWGAATTSDVSLTLDSDATFSAYSYVASGKTFDNFVLKPMFESGSTASPWQPYENICPISGRTGLSVYRTGKNQTNYNTPLEAPTGNTATVNLFNMDLIGGRTYTFSCKQSASLASSTRNTLCIKPSGGSAVYENGGTNYNPTDLRHVLTYTAPSTGEYTFQYWGNTLSAAVTLDEWQVEIGSSFTEYEPFVDSDTYSSDWTSPAGTVYGGSLDLVTGVLTVDRASVLLGDLTWTETTTSGSNKRVVSSDLSGSIKPPSGGSVVANILCENYKPETANNVYSETIGIAVTSTGGLSVYDPNYQTGTAFKNATGNVRLVYELANPLTYQLTPQEVDLLLGENYLWESSGADLSLTYYADGNANTLDALNLMLGNRYVNNHTPDDVSDREALDILLGR